MKRQTGGALITTLILLTAIAIMLSTIIYVTQQFSKKSEAVQDSTILRHTAYISMLENEAILIRQSQKNRFQNILRSSQLSIPIDSTKWIVKNYPEEGINYYAYARNYIDYLPSDVSMFSSNGSYVYSLFAKAAHQPNEQGFIYHENFWINSDNVFSKSDNRLIFSLPRIRPNYMAEADYERYLSALDSYTKSVLVSIDHKKITIDSESMHGTYSVSQLCDRNDSCKLSSGWVVKPNVFKWVVAVYSEKGAYIWIAGAAGDEELMTPTIKLELGDDAEIKSNLVFIRMQGETYFAYVEKDKKGNDKNDDSASNNYLTSSGVSSVSCSAVNNGYCACTKSKKDRLQRCMELIDTKNQNDSRVSQCQAQYGGNNPNQAGYQCKDVCKPGLNASCVNLQPSAGSGDSSRNTNGGKTELVLRDLESGEIINKINASVSSVGKDSFMLSVVDLNSDLEAEQMLIFGDKGKYGIAEVSEHSLNNMSKKYKVNSDALIQPLIVSPLSNLGQNYQIFAIMQNQIQAFTSIGNDLDSISDGWNLSSLSDIHYVLPYGGLLFVQYGNNNLAVVTMNKGLVLKTYTGISQDFTIKANMQSELLYLVSGVSQIDISAITLQFMRENLKQVNND
ncbi:hypothetical protein OAO18_06710 [Francisellaceae bacterium]|nr:hypothetical protein [Francisellaceae bacterium]